jgi:hypothetical protein
MVSPTPEMLARWDEEDEREDITGIDITSHRSLYGGSGELAHQVRIAQLLGPGTEYVASARLLSNRITSAMSAMAGRSAPGEGR